MEVGPIGVGVAYLFFFWLFGWLLNPRLAEIRVELAGCRCDPLPLPRLMMCAGAEKDLRHQDATTTRMPGPLPRDGVCSDPGWHLDGEEVQRMAEHDIALLDEVCAPAATPPPVAGSLVGRCNGV